MIWCHFSEQKVDRNLLHHCFTVKNLTNDNWENVLAPYFHTNTLGTFIFLQFCLLTFRMISTQCAFLQSSKPNNFYLKNATERIVCCIYFSKGGCYDLMGESENMSRKITYNGSHPSCRCQHWEKRSLDLDFPHKDRRSEGVASSFN